MIAIILVLLLVLILSFIEAYIFTWAICFILGLCGIALAFSWKLVIVIWVILAILNGIFKANK